MKKANADGVGETGHYDRHRSDVPSTYRSGGAIPVANIARMIFRDWKRIALTTVAATLIAWSLAVLQPPRYRASALASIAPRTDTLQPNEFLRGVEVLEQRTVVATIASLASTPVIRTQAGARSEHFVEAAVMPNTNLFRIDVEGGNAAEAAAIANRVPPLLSAQASTMYKYYVVTMVSPAVAPDEPFLPRPRRAIAAGVIIGLFLGVLAAYATRWRAARRGSAS